MAEYYICPQNRLQNSFAGTTWFLLWSCRSVAVFWKPKLWQLNHGWSRSAGILTTKTDSNAVLSTALPELRIWLPSYYKIVRKTLWRKYLVTLKLYLC